MDRICSALHDVQRRAPVTGSTRDPDGDGLRGLDRHRSGGRFCGGDHRLWRFGFLPAHCFGQSDYRRSYRAQVRDRLNAMEQEFRDILGIEDESDSAEARITPALVPDKTGLLYMLSNRVESWFRMFSLSPIDRIAGMPVFVTCFQEVVDEVIEMGRAACQRSGKDFSVDAHPLVSIPAFGDGQAQAFFEEPPESKLLTACRREFGELIRIASEGIDTGFEGRRCSLQGGFEKLCQEFQACEGHKTNISLTVLKGGTLANVLDFSGTELAGEITARPFVLLSVTAG